MLLQVTTRQLVFTYYQNVLLPKHPITRMSSYRNVQLPKCLLPKRPLPKCPLPKCMDTRSDLGVCPLQRWCPLQSDLLIKFLSADIWQRICGDNMSHHFVLSPACVRVLIGRRQRLFFVVCSGTRLTRLFYRGCLGNRHFCK